MHSHCRQNDTFQLIKIVHLSNSADTPVPLVLVFIIFCYLFVSECLPFLFQHWRNQPQKHSVAGRLERGLALTGQ